MLTVAGLMLVVAAVAAFYQVVSRFVLHIPSHWSEPLVRIMLIWMVYLALMAGVRSGSMLAIDFLLKKMSGAWHRLMRLMVLVSMLVTFAILFYYGAQAVYLVRNQTIAGLGISASWIYSAIPVGALFASLAAVARFLAPDSVAEDMTDMGT